MKQMVHRAGEPQRAAALVAALALLFHIATMAFGIGRLPNMDPAIAGAHARNTASKADHDPGHKPSCCILSVCPSLPPPSLDPTLARLPQPDTCTLTYGFVQATVPCIPLLPPVGARAPPVPV